jgi:Rod binding domain-containing protein
MLSTSPAAIPVQQSYRADVPAVRPGQSLESAAKGFEETFLAQLLKEMRQTLEPETLFGRDGGDVFGGMFDQFMAKHLTQAGGIGLAANLKHQHEQGTTHNGDSRRGLHAPA